METLIRKLPSMGDKKDDICKKIDGLYNTSKKFRDSLFCGNGMETKLRNDYRSYRGWTGEDNEDTVNKHSILMVFAMTRAILSELMGRPASPKLRASRTTKQLDNEVLNKFLKRQAELSNSYKVWRDFTVMKILHGTGIVRKQWDTKKYTYSHKVPSIAPDSSGLLMPKEQVVEVEDIVYEGWKDEFVSLMNFFWDPFGESMDTCSWVIEVDNYFTIDDIERYNETGVFQIPSKDLKELKNAYAASGNFGEPHNRSDFQTADPERFENLGTFPMLRYFTDTEVFYVLAMGTGGTLLLNQSKEFQANPYKIKHPHRKPYIHSQFWPLPGEFLGLGIGDMANGYQYYANKAIQMELDSMKMNLTRKFIVRKNAIVNTDHLVDDSNLIVWVKDMDGIRDLPPIPSMGSGVNLMNALQRGAEEDLGINKIMQGNRLEGTVTATEAAEVASMGRKQLSVPFFNHMEAIKEHFKMSCCYNFLFMEEEAIVYNGVELNIKGDFFDINNLEVDVDETSVSANFEALWQKRIEMMAQALEPHVQFGYVNIKALDIARVIAAGLDPRDFILMDGEQSFSSEDEFFKQTAQLIGAQREEVGMPEEAMMGGGNAAANMKGPVVGPDTNMQPGADTIGTEMLKEGMA